jgi:hypothetical protein
MPPTKLAASSRFIRPGVTKVYWVVTIATQATPTRSELNAGSDLSDEVAEINGFQVVAESVDTPDLSGRFVPKIPGRINAEDSSINFYASSTGFNDARSVLVLDSQGYVVIMDGGDVSTTGRMDVYKCKVASHGKIRTLEDPAQTQANFTILVQPSENVVIPA